MTPLEIAAYVKYRAWYAVWRHENGITSADIQAMRAFSQEYYDNQALTTDRDMLETLYLRLQYERNRA